MYVNNMSNFGMEFQIIKLLHVCTTLRLASYGRHQGLFQISGEIIKGN